MDFSLPIMTCNYCTIVAERQPRQKTTTISPKTVDGTVVESNKKNVQRNKRIWICGKQRPSHIKQLTANSRMEYKLSHHAVSKLLKNHKIDILLISETHFTDKSFFNISEFMYNTKHPNVLFMTGQQFL